MNNIKTAQTTCRTKLKQTWTSLFLSLFMVASISSVSHAATEPITDQDITMALSERLAKSDAIDENWIDIETKNGIVTLKGHVSNILEKDRSEKIAESLKGVRSTINRILVKPVIRPDEEIADDIRKAVKNDPAVDKEQVNVRVTDGLAVITGNADSHAELQLSTILAKNIKGVREVDNQIVIHYTKDRKDSEIEKGIERRFESDVRIRADLLNVEVNNGVVDISGTVGSLGEKRRAEQLAWIHGVKRVKSMDDVTVDWTRFDTIKPAATYEDLPRPKSDAEIREAVEDAFVYDPRVESYNPQVFVKNGVVTLTGIAKDMRAKHAAEEDTKNTAGVLRVKNLIQVRPDQIQSDSKIRNIVQQAILSDPYLEKKSIKVTVIDGEAYLNGNVDNRYEKGRAAVVAWKARGVKDVHNYLDVASPWWNVNDEEIRSDIYNELEWNSYVDGDDITVTLYEGTVTLTGRVDTSIEKRMAEEEALEAGAKAVINRLEVAYYKNDDQSS